MRTACTIIARNYLAQARVLSQSFRDHHPGGRIAALVLDDAERALGPGEPFDVLRPEDIMSSEEFGRMATMYSVVELATAVKPWLLRHLLDEGALSVAYFDPDIRIFTPLPEIFALAETQGVALTPHALTPLPRDGTVTQPEDVILDVGIFNLGFIAVSARTPAVRWWADHVRRECIIAPRHGRFVDQRWVDLFVGYFDPAILRDPGMNVAWWNLATRRVTADGAAYLVDGQALRFFHFSGYDPDMPWLVSRHQGPLPRVLLSDQPALLRITAEYAALLREAGYDEASRTRYGLAATPGGLTLDGRMRALYRDALIAAERDGSPEPPCPFLGVDTLFVEWLAGADPAASGTKPAGRYLHALWRDSPDLRDRFSDVHGRHANAFATWARTEGVTSGRVPPQIGVATTVPPPDSLEPPPDPAAGIHVVGFLAADRTEGEVARRLIRAMADSGMAVRGTSVTRMVGPGDHPTDPRAVTDGVHPVNLLVLPAQRILEGAHLIGPEAREGRRHVAVLVCDDGLPPAVPVSALEIIDEIWVCSAFAADICHTLSARPVFLMPVPSSAEEPAAWDHMPATAHDGDFVVAVVVDLADDARRTNPDGALRAYLSAFGPDDDACLVVGVTHADHDGQCLELLRYLGRDRPDVTITEIDVHAVRGLIAAANCLLSLPRCGDLPLGVLDSLAIGTPVVASGNTGAADVITTDTAWPVGSAGAQHDPTLTGDPASWCEPDLDTAAAALRAIRDDPTEATRRAATAMARDREHHSQEATVAFLSARLAAWRDDDAARAQNSAPARRRSLGTQR